MMEPPERLTADQELELIRRAQAGDRDAVGLLLQDLHHYIHAMATTWHFKQPHYATWWIWQHLGRMRRYGDVVHRPLGVHDLRKTTSLDKPTLHEGRPTTLVTTVESRDDPVFSNVTRREAVDRVAPLLKVLPQRDREILLMRQTMSLSEVAVQFGIGNERVRQIEKRALHRVKIEAYRLGFADDGGRERTTITSYDCPRCQSHDTKSVRQDPRQWQCRDCGRQFVPDAMRIGTSASNSQPTDGIQTYS